VLGEKLNHLPAGPGVYLFRDGAGRVIYVGKAASLKSRVRPYFQSGARHQPKTRVMVEKAADLEWIVVDSEVEALILEQNLIKEHRPRYNVLLKDDKSYPYLKVTLNEGFPRVFVTRRVVKDGGRYFGPYTRVGAVNETLSLLKKVFPFRSCKQREPAARSRPCLNHHIKRCLGPCCGLVDREAYRAMIDEVCLFLEGRQDDLVRRLTERMREAAGKLEFEQAAGLRDQIAAVQEILEKQKVISTGFADRDVIALAGGPAFSVAEVFLVRGGKLIGREQFVLEGDLDGAEMLGAFVKQYYSRVDLVPPEVLLSAEIGEEKAVIEKWLTGKRGTGVRLKVPGRGEKRGLVEMAARNAVLALELEQRRAEEPAGGTEAPAELARVLGLPEPPRRLECFDVSNIQGREAVASMAVFEAGRPAKGEYRRFKIRTVEGPDDYASLREVARRRFIRAREGQELSGLAVSGGVLPDDGEKPVSRKGRSSAGGAGFHRLPDLVVVDGGKGQLSAVREAMEETGFGHIPACGLAKKEEHIFVPGRPEPVILPGDSPALRLLQRLRDEAHRFAVAYHRRRREKQSLKSLLDEVEGIGAVRRRALLRAFGSLAGIEKAEIGELAAVPGMNSRAARAVYEFFRK
jgi:excinuclease ABC subunit C